MPGVIHPIATYANIAAPEACSYTLSHGQTPGCAVLRCSPQLAPPAPDGTLVITDGVLGEIILNNCHLDEMKVSRDSRGTYWSLRILDRRWKWARFGALGGAYNQLDPFGKLLPWTIRSPTELAQICLDAMGEVGYTILMPPGINYPGPYTSQPIVNISGVNPPVNWDGVPPAQALQQLCDMFGVRLVYQWNTDAVLITPIGVGNDLPRGSIHTQSIALRNPETPDSIAVRGAPTRYQVRLNLFPVGEDWDGSIRPIEYLSYAPRPNNNGQGATQISQIDLVNPDIGTTWLVYVNGFEMQVSSAGDVNSDLANIADAINGNDNVNTIVSASIATDTAGDPVVQVESLAAGVSFAISTDVNGSGTPPPAIEDVLIQAALPALPPGKGTWQYCAPPLFTGVRATDRLTLSQALALARKSVWRYYQVWNVESGHAPGVPITVPGYSKNPILRPQQLVLTDKQVDQIVPQKNDDNILGPDGRPLNVNFYNGYSRDVPGAIYGSVYNLNSNLNNGIWYPKAAYNTPAGAQVFTSFSIVQEFCMVIFSSPVYYFGAVANDQRNPDGTIPAGDPGGYFAPSPLTIQTAVLVRDPVTNEIDHFWKLIPLPGYSTGTNPRVYQHDDVQVNVTSTYNQNQQLTGSNLLEADPLIRADYYLASHLKEYELTGALINEYNGIMEIDVDGAIQQVTWSVGAEGGTTTASYNTEHSHWISSYPERRRAEFLDPAQGKVYQWDTVVPLFVGPPRPS